MTSCDDRTPTEDHTAYAARVLTYALQLGIEPLTLSQLEIADAQAQRHVAQLPGTLDPDAARLDATLHALRLRLQTRMAEQRAQRAQLQRLFAQAQREPPPAPDAPGDEQAPQDDQTRALLLLRAALQLIMAPGTDQEGGDGGRPARLIRPTPTRPPGGAHADAPTQLQDRPAYTGPLPRLYRPGDGVAF